MARKGTLTVRLVGDSKPLERTLGGVGSSLGRFVAGVGAAAAAAAGVVAVKGVEAAREAAEINRITENVIRSTGGAANVTAKQVDDLSSRLQNLTGVSDETIQRGSNMLLTFTNIRNELGEGNKIFDRATALALDMSVAMGTDVKDSAIQLGKALNDPIKGVSALSRVGVQFTDQQKDQIKVLMESGDVLGAQKIILAELGTQFGGTAEAAADPMKKLTSIIGDVVEVIGVALMPVMDRAATFLANNLPNAIQTVMGWFSDVSAKVRDVVDRFRGFLESNAETVGAWRTSLGDVFEQVQAIVADAWETMQAVFAAAVDIVTALWERFGTHLVDFFMRTWGRITEFLSNVLEIIRGVFEAFAGLLTGDWSRMWDGLKLVADGAWGAIQGIVSQAFDTLKTAFGGAVAVLSAPFKAIWDGLKGIALNAVNAVIGYAEGMINTVIRAANQVQGVLDVVAGPLVNFESFEDVDLGRVGGPQPVAIPRTGGMGGIQEFAAGGIVTRPMTGLVGEAGPEAIIPLDRARDLFGTAPAPVVNITVNAPNYVGDKRDLADAITEVLVSQSRRNLSISAAI